MTDCIDKPGVVTDAQKAAAAAAYIWEIGVNAEYLLKCHGCSERRPVDMGDVRKLKGHIARLQSYVEDVENGEKAD